MEFDLRDLHGENLERALTQFDTDGYLLLDGVEESITARFLPIMAERMKASASEFDAIRNPDSTPVVLPVEIRERLSRIATSPDLAAGLLHSLEPLITRVLGPLVHVSSTFHGQFKGGEIPAVDHGGYQKEYLEVQGQYLLHQDFTGASLPTSPCAVTLWVGLNTTPDWNLRLYPGSHRAGLLCHQWLRLDDPRLARFGAPVDVSAKVGRAVLFNSLLLHSSSHPGPRRRISCDIRFFPLCGFLPSLPYVLGTHPATALDEALARPDGPTLRAATLETIAWLGGALPDDSVPPHSILNWGRYLAAYLADEPNAVDWMVRFVNETDGADPASVYTAKFDGRDPVTATLEHAQRLIVDREPKHPLARGLDPLLARLSRTSQRTPA